MTYTIKVTTSDVQSVQDAAKAIGCSRLAVYRWIEKGRIIGLRFGGILFVPVSEVERLKREINAQAAEQERETEIERLENEVERLKRENKNEQTAGPAA